MAKVAMVLTAIITGFLALIILIIYLFGILTHEMTDWTIIIYELLAAVFILLATFLGFLSIVYHKKQ
jgi:hypothetical protein